MRLAATASLMLALSGCAATPPEAPPDAGPGAQTAVAAFARACGSLARAEALTRAGALGFVAARGTPMAEAVLQQAEARGATVLVRPNPAPALLFWHDAPHCEVAVPNPDGPALEAEFARLLAALSAAAAASGGVAQFALASPEQVARLAGAEAARGEAGRLVALGVVAPRVPLPGATARVFSLRLPGPGGTFAAMVHRGAPITAGSAGAGGAGAGGAGAGGAWAGVAAAPPALSSDAKELPAR